MHVIVTFISVIVIITLLNKIYEKNWNKRLFVNVEFSKKHATTGETIELVETIINQKALPIPLLNVKFKMSKNLLFLDDMDNQSSDFYYRNDIFSLLMYQKITRTLEIQCIKRGYYQLSRLDLHFDTLFNNVPQNLTMLEHGEFYVLPQSLPFSDFQILYQHIMGEIQSRRLIQEDPFEVIGIREYQSYDTMKSINWKASARTMDLKVNIPSHTMNQEVTILLNLESPLTRRFDHIMEESISISSTLAEQLISQGITVSLISNGCDILTSDATIVLRSASPAQIITIKESLARIDLNIPCKSTSSFFAPYLSSTNTNSYIILISAYQRDDLVEELNHSITNKNAFTWIFPTNEEYSLPVSFQYPNRILTWKIKS